MKIFMDFDGDLNSIQFKGTRKNLEGKSGFSDFAETTLKWGTQVRPVVYSPTRNLKLKQIIANDQPVWVTTWIPYIDQVQGLTKIKGSIPAGIPADITMNMGIDWKEKAVLASVEDGERFVWFDDRAITQSFREKNPQALLISPNINIGLTQDDLDRIDAYINNSEETAAETLDSLDLKPTAAMAAEGQRGLDWRKEFNRGGTPVGVARARDLSNRVNLSPDTVLRMHSYFSRHAVDKNAEGFRPGEKGFPSAGRIAWALWGGDPGESWSRIRAEKIQRIRGK